MLSTAIMHVAHCTKVKPTLRGDLEEVWIAHQVAATDSQYGEILRYGTLPREQRTSQSIYCHSRFS